MVKAQEDTANRFADAVDEIARRLRLPNPDPQIIEAAAGDLELLARTIREEAAATGEASGGGTVTTSDPGETK